MPKPSILIAAYSCDVDHSQIDKILKADTGHCIINEEKNNTSNVTVTKTGQK